MYLRKRQSSELSGSVVELTLRVSNLLVGLVLGTGLRNGVLEAVPSAAWKHWGGCLFPSWTPGVYEGGWGSLNLRDPVLSKGVNDDKRYEAGKNLTGRGCSISYSKEMGNGLVVNGIHSSNPLVLCISKVDNWSGSKDRRCEATNIRNEEPHLPFYEIEKFQVGLWSALFYTSRVFSYACDDLV